ncbi:MAG TPA: hypothetical protein VKB75_16875 [Jatrophihabitans sp.]|nr:hypothetical protein [Jatrophihabitans sp.]
MQKPITVENQSDEQQPPVEFTPMARAAIATACQSEGPQVVLLAWPAGATYLPQRCYSPSAFDIVLGDLEASPVYTDARRLSLFVNRHIVIDGEARIPTRTRPWLRVYEMTLDAAERHDTRDWLQVRTSARFNDIVIGVVGELSSQFVPLVPESMIWAHVRAAVSDLAGSAKTQTLPELAMRLAHYRLSVAASSLPMDVDLSIVA